jgi:hypothetical protein
MRIIDHTPASFNTAQSVWPFAYSSTWNTASLRKCCLLANGNGNTRQSNEEIVPTALDNTTNEKLSILLPCIILVDSIGTPYEVNPLTEQS